MTTVGRVVNTCDSPCPGGQISILGWIMSDVPVPHQINQHYQQLVLKFVSFHVPLQHLLLTGMAHAQPHASFHLSHKSLSLVLTALIPVLPVSISIITALAFLPVRLTSLNTAFLAKPVCNFPCTPSQHLYSNGSCFSSCQTYFNPCTLVADKYCNFPCSNRTVSLHKWIMSTHLRLSIHLHHTCRRALLRLSMCCHTVPISRRIMSILMPRILCAVAR